MELQAAGVVSACSCVHIHVQGNVVALARVGKTGQVRRELSTRVVDACARGQGTRARPCLCARLGNGWKIDNGVRVPDAASPVSARARFSTENFSEPPIAGPVLHRFRVVLRSLPLRRFFFPRFPSPRPLSLSRRFFATPSLARRYFFPIVVQLVDDAWILRSEKGCRKVDLGVERLRTMERMTTTMMVRLWWNFRCCWNLLSRQYVLGEK